ncbi:MAG: hypothetical protein ACPLPR_09860 [Bacillota bacterium]
MEIVYASNGKPIGHVKQVFGKKVFIKNVDPAKHFCRKLGAWGTDLSVILRLRASGVEATQLRLPSGIVLEASLDLILKRGVVADLGAGPQVFLAKDFWHVVGARQLELFQGGTVA